jgi:hypothetical protein
VRSTLRVGAGKCEPVHATRLQGSCTYFEAIVEDFEEVRGVLLVRERVAVPAVQREEG